MNILKYKYKAHKFINSAFYLVVFILGFILGFFSEKIDFNKLIFQFLAIENVEAYEVSRAGFQFDEEKIVNLFNQYFDADFSDYSNVLVNVSGSSSSGTISIMYLPDNFTEHLTLRSTQDAYYIYTLTDNPGYYRIYSNNTTSFNNNLDVSHTFRTSDSSNFQVYYGRGTYQYWAYSSIGLTFPNATGFKYPEVFDFSSYLIPGFNENLFRDNPNFKEVCVNNYDTFSITSNEIQDYDENNSPMYHSFDFMWFPNGMKGISTWGYDTDEPDHVYLFEQDDNTFSGWWYWLNTRDEIDLYFGRDNPGLYLSAKGYTNKYDYYNWSFYPFEMTFTESYHRYQAFWFKDPYIEYLDGTIKDDSEEYCFYIKNEYDVNILNKNQNGDFNSTITILGGINRYDATYENEFNNNSNGFLNKIYNFISKIKPTVNFINSHILELYTSMPLIVRSFIISFLALILIRIVIGMVIK